MKRILYSICMGSLALAVTAWGAEVNDTTAVKTKKARVTATTSARTGAAVNSSTQVRAHRDMANARVRQRSNATAQTTESPAVNRNRMRNMSENTRVRARNDVTVSRERERNVVNRNRNAMVNRNQNVMVNRERNIGMNRNVTVRRGANATVTNNWRSGQFSGRQYTAFRNYHRTWHDRGWWRSHYSRIIFVSGGWWYWNAGYWYPAWGYDSYAYYPYDGPIYGYSNLAPDQVISEVQAQLQRDGYYAGPIDGVLGPMTRRAIAAFQADHGLAITSTVDEPTLATLGIS